MSSYIIFGSGLAAELEFSYGTGQTVNLLALRLQWFESTPTQASPKAIFQVFKPFGGQLGISSPVSDTNLFRTSRRVLWDMSGRWSNLRVRANACSKRNGDPSHALSHAMRQILDWRSWLTANIDYARRSETLMDWVSAMSIRMRLA